MKLLIVLSILIATSSAASFVNNLLRPKSLSSLEIQSDSGVDPEGFITNGEIAKAKQFPYQAGLEIHIGKKSGWCGGTLISNEWVLTAAHCTDSADALTIFLGFTDLKKNDGIKLHTPYENIIIHKGWDPRTIVNDISVVRLPKKVNFNDFIQPATLPKMGEDHSSYEGEIAWASGWGKASDSSTTVSQHLRYITVPILKNTACNRFFFGAVQPSNICISGKKGRSTCNGDSGGPLIFKDGKINYLIGATSFGIAIGCEKGFPGVFTRTTAYLDWIADKTGVVNRDLGFTQTKHK